MPTIAVAAIAGTVPTAVAYEYEGDPLSRPTVLVGDLNIPPFANLTYNNNRVELHPTGRVQVGYDNNVFQTESNEIDDWYQQLDVGLETRAYLSDISLLVIDADIFHRNYVDQNARDFTGGEIDLEYVRESQFWRKTWSLGYRREDDPSLENARTVERQEIVAAAGLKRQGNGWGWTIDASANRIDYLEDTPFFDTDTRDRDRYGVIGGITRTLGEEAEIAGRFGITRTRYLESSTPLQDSWSFLPSVRYKRPVGDRGALRLEAGLDIRLFDDDFSEDPAYDDATVVWPFANIRYRWRYRELSYFQVSAVSSAYDGASSNAIYTWGPRLEIEHELPGRWQLYGSGQYIQREASGAAAGFQTSESDAITLEMQARYRLRTGFVFRGGVLYRDFMSNFAGSDYQQVIVTVDASMAF